MKELEPNVESALHSNETFVNIERQEPTRTQRWYDFFISIGEVTLNLITVACC